MTLDQAQKLGLHVLHVLRPFCLKAEIAGSTRREKKDFIKDIEVVILPRNECARELADAINTTWGAPSIGKWPSKYTRIRATYNLDIFTATAENFAMIYFIRTGPAEYVQRALADWKKKTNGGYCEGGVLHSADGQKVQTLTEDEVFVRLGRKFCPPHLRF